MIVAHVIPLCANNRHAAHFRKACGVKRFAWNWGLAQWDARFKALNPPITDDYGNSAGFGKRAIDDGYGNPVRPHNAQSLKKEFSALIDDQWPWMRETSSHAYQRAFPELENAYRRFFKGLGEQPTMKQRRKARDSFYLANTAIKIEGRHVTIQKLGRVRMAIPLRFSGKIMSARIARDADRWQMSVAVEIPDREPPMHTQADVVVGVDLGVKTAAVFSTGEERHGAKAVARYQRRLQRYQRRLSRQMEQAKKGIGLAPNAPLKKGDKLPVSGRMVRVKSAIQRLHRKIRNQRNNAQHQLTAELTKRFGMIAIEDLGVKGMTASASLKAKTQRAEKKGKTVKPGTITRKRQKAGLNRAILDVGFGEIRRQLEYKAKRTGSRLVVVDRWVPSSKTCNACGVIQPSMPLSVRAWVCPECGAYHDRDVNAAKNLRDIGASMPVPEKKDVKRVGKVNPARKQKVSSVEESTGGVPESQARGESGQQDASVKREPGAAETPVRPVSSGDVATHSLTVRRFGKRVKPMQMPLFSTG